MKKLVGIWSITSKAIGWMEESHGVPAVFDKEVDAKRWLKDNTAHPNNYEVRPYKGKDPRSAKEISWIN